MPKRAIARHLPALAAVALMVIGIACAERSSNETSTVAAQGPELGHAERIVEHAAALAVGSDGSGTALMADLYDEGFRDLPLDTPFATAAEQDAAFHACVQIRLQRMIGQPASWPDDAVKEKLAEQLQSGDAEVRISAARAVAVLSPVEWDGRNLAEGAAAEADEEVARWKQVGMALSATGPPIDELLEDDGWVPGPRSQLRWAASIDW